MEQQPLRYPAQSGAPDPGRSGRRQPTNLTNGESTCLPETRSHQQSICTVKSTQELQSGFPEKLEAKVTFFKGMYSDLTDRSICLKLWNGEKWIWTDCNLKGRPFPQDGQLMSPTLVKEGRRYLLNIPVKQENSDARTAKERMQKARTCAVSVLQTQTPSQCAAFWMSREISWLYTPAGAEMRTATAASCWRPEYRNLDRTQWR